MATTSCRQTASWSCCCCCRPPHARHALSAPGCFVWGLNTKEKQDEPWLSRTWGRQDRRDSSRRPKPLTGQLAKLYSLSLDVTGRNGTKLVVFTGCYYRRHVACESKRKHGTERAMSRKIAFYRNRRRSVVGRCVEYTARRAWRIFHICRLQMPIRNWYTMPRAFEALRTFVFIPGHGALLSQAQPCCNPYRHGIQFNQQS